MKRLIAMLSLVLSVPAVGADDFALRLAVTPAPGGGLQRIDLPAEALAALRSPGRDDIRILDAKGVPLPMAVAAPPGGIATLATVRLEALPIRGPAGALAADGAELKIERRDGDQVVTVIQGRAADAPPVTLGALFDTRTIDARGRRIALDILLPPQQPITFTIEASRDLATWTPVGGKVLYRRSGDAAGALGPEAIPLGDIALKDHYLRVTWSSPQRLLGPVELRAATVEFARSSARSERPSIATSPPRRIDAHDIRFTLPRALVIAAVAIEPTAGEMLAPVRILGRNAPDQPWTPLGSAVVRVGDATQIDLSGGAYADYRIEADKRTPGFAAPPGLRLFFEPARIALLFNGNPPYTLAVGAAGVRSAYLPIGQLIPAYRPGAENRLPLAIAAATPDARLTLAAGEDSPFSPKKTLLWGLLLLGVAALGFMIWRLWRPKAGDPPAP